MSSKQSASGLTSYVNINRCTMVSAIALSALVLAVNMYTDYVLDGTTRLLRRRFRSAHINLNVLGPDIPWKDIIKQTYVINMKSDGFKMKLMEAEMTRHKIPFQRFEAINTRNIQNIIARNPLPRNMSSMLDPRFNADPQCWLPNRDTTVCKELSSDTSGLAFSHMSVWLQAIDSVEDGRANDGAILIFEDDVALSDAFENIVPKLVSNLNKLDDKWVILGLGYSANHNPSVGIPYLLDKNEGFGCMHAYILRDARSAQLMFDIENTPWVPRNDHGWWKLVQRNDQHRSYVYVPNDIAVQINQHPNLLKVF